jgi:predicted anti-sigma-YlaC factor YlaD
MPELKATCKEVHAMISAGLDRELPLDEQLRLRSHLLICLACRRFDDQMLLLRQAMQRLAGRPASAAPDPAPPGA